MVFDTSRIGSRLDLLYLITREFNATPDIDQALNNVLSAIVATVRASDASLFLLDTEGRVQNSLLISGFEAKKQGRSIPEHPSPGGVLGWVQQHRKGIIIADTNSDERWHNEEFIPEAHQANSAICVPVQLPDQLIGVLTITAPQTNHFDDNDLAMLTIIADHAAFALDNARLLEAEQIRRRLADTLTSIAHTINSTLDLKKVLDLILEQLSRVVDYDSSSILLYDDIKKTLAVQAARGFEDMKDAMSVELPFDENIPNYQAILQKKPVVIANVDAEPYWIKSSSSEQVKSWLGAPLIARDEVVGILTLDSHEQGKYTQENVDIVAVLADQAASAVANAQAVTGLQRAEATYSMLFEDSTDLIIITTYDGLILNINRKACQILRRPKDVFIDLDIAFINSQLTEFLIQQTKRLKVWREASIEIVATDAYWQKIPLEIKIRNIQYRGQDCVEWVGRDISVRKQIERTRQDMVNMLVHDLRGPLGNLINTIDLISLMMGSSANDPKIQKILGMAKRSGQSLNDMVDSMLDVSRLEEGELPLQRTLTRLDKLVTAVQDQVIHHVEAKKMELTIHPLPKEVSAVWMDRSLIRRVLVNIVGNALKYTPEEGRISLTTTVTDNQLHFAISDNGPGISQADQVDVFDKFSRVDYSVNAPVGVGLGLAFCKLATEAHGGTISVESEGVSGKGSTFYIKIPIIKESEVVGG